ncbi:hypothetical protein BU17DRAFT_102873 [Hysterangium stoloniferum]|nr:hypothetical protein BU17DRAFT_102873 [Hysterangium stoloniferum]
MSSSKAGTIVDEAMWYPHDLKVRNVARQRRGTFWLASIITMLVFGMLHLWIRWSKDTDDRSMILNKSDHAENWQEMMPGTVKWWPCDGPNDLPGSECGFIMQVSCLTLRTIPNLYSNWYSVPLDYFNASAGVAKVALGRYNATTTPRKGMVLYNPGGPGGSGKPRATQQGSTFQALTGTDYDFVGFDPRGIGETKPAVQCFAPGQYDQFTKHTILQRGFDVGPNMSDPFTRDHLLSQQREADVLYKAQFEVCARTMGETLRYMGSSTVSRDLDFITTALEGKDALINFYGFSYGTILAAYLINMFPNRIGRVVIDGVADTVDWTSLPAYKWYRSWLKYTEPTYDLFMSDCSKAGPSACPLADYQNEDPAAIMGRVESFINSLYIKPLAVSDAASPGILTYGAARIPLFSALQRPLTWRTFAVTLSEAMKGNASQLLTMTQGSYLGDLQRSAVSCNDQAPFPPPSAEEVINESIEVLETVTRFAMTVMTTEPDSGCHYWPVTPPERYNGPWNHTLNNRVLIHSNLLDPVTPMSSGVALKDLLGDSATLALREGPGHCSTSLPSLCSAKLTRKYFADGTLPPDGHLCSVDVAPFQDPEMSHASLNEEDRYLLGHLQDLALIFNHMH